LSTKTSTETAFTAQIVGANGGKHEFTGAFDERKIVVVGATRRGERFEVMGVLNSDCKALGEGRAAKPTE
jgi:hypothetical protein